ncbi:hypothetical protein BV898_11968 [Hypsibius exemplaris]|uniref:Cation-transporting ATPase n=1 Tax=Hypsibius exemplaris TaxID=2072580 RepID=A0A1W0WF82_HYPEX|nr:hypothetical protein BV898_11968 [Hypsibius exemplaris]
MSSTIVPPDRPIDVPGPAAAEGVEYRPHARRYASVRIEDGVKEFIDVWGYKAQFWKSVLFHFIGIITLGLGYVVLSWCPIWITAIKKTPCEVQEADTVLLKDSHGNYFSHSVKQKVLTRKPKLISRDVAEFGLLTSDPPDDARHAAKSLGLELPKRRGYLFVNKSAGFYNDMPRGIRLVVDCSVGKIRQNILDQSVRFEDANRGS